MRENRSLYFYKSGFDVGRMPDEPERSDGNPQKSGKRAAAIVSRRSVVAA